MSARDREAQTWWDGQRGERKVSLSNWLDGQGRGTTQVDGQIENADWVLFEPKDVPVQPTDVERADRWWDALPSGRQVSVHRWIEHGEPLNHVPGQIDALEVTQ